MQTPEHTVGTLTFMALPACLASYGIPPELAQWAEWLVTAYTGDAWTEIQAGWIADVPPGRRAGQRGRGPFMVYIGGAVNAGPPLTYVSHARSSRQGLRLAAEAYTAWLARQNQPRRRTAARR